MAKNDIMQNVDSPSDSGGKTLVSAVVDTISDTANRFGTRAMMTLKETTNIAAKVKVRTQKRFKDLYESSKWKTTKEIIAGNFEHVSAPPAMNIGELRMSISGGIGKIHYVEYMRDPNSGGNMQFPNGGGLIKTHYVEEIIEPMETIKTKRSEIRGVPSLKQIQEQWAEVYKNEKAKIRASRGA